MKIPMFVVVGPTFTSSYEHDAQNDYGTLDLLDADIRTKSKLYFLNALNI